MLDVVKAKKTAEERRAEKIVQDTYGKNAVLLRYRGGYAVAYMIVNEGHREPVHAAIDAEGSRLTSVLHTLADVDYRIAEGA